jgi:hypothetical protein
MTGGLRQGKALLSLALVGWSDGSIFGWDSGDATWWTQLWRDGSASDEPEIGLGYVPPIRTIDQPRQLVAGRTGGKSDAVEPSVVGSARGARRAAVMVTLGQRL